MIVRALVIGLAVAIAGIDAFSMWLQFQNNRNYPGIDFEPSLTYAFVLPQTQLGCLDYHAGDGEVFMRWQFEQPLRIWKQKDDHLTLDQDLFSGPGAVCDFAQSSVSNVVWIKIE